MSNSVNVALRFLSEDLAKCQSGNELLAVIDAYLSAS